MRDPRCPSHSSFSLNPSFAFGYSRLFRVANGEQSRVDAYGVCGQVGRCNLCHLSYRQVLVLQVDLQYPEYGLILSDL